MSTVRPGAPSIKHTVVEEGSSFKGTLTSSCPIHVHGRIEGELTTPSLTVSATGAVHGRAKVGAVRSQGEISGEFDADSVELAGTVRDNTVIRARSLEVKLASARGKLQVIFGECELAVGDEPRESEVVEPASIAEAMAAVVAPAMLPPEPMPLPSDPVATVEASTAAPESDDADEGDAELEISAVEGEGGAVKRRRKRKSGEGEGTKTGWSQPPSRPPPAN